MKKDSSKWLAGGLIVLLVIILFGLISFSNTKIDTSLDLNEKKWLEVNKKNVINVSVANNIPVFSENGEGVFFDFLTKVENETGLTFNLISYDASSETKKNDLYFDVLKQESFKTIKKDDMVFYNDYYVLVSKNDERIKEPNEIINKRIGVFSKDLKSVSYNIPNDGNITYTEYKDIDELKKALDDDSVDYIAVPKTRYASLIISNSYHVAYNLTELKEAYVLKTKDGIDGNLKSIITKEFTDYKVNTLEKDYNASLIEMLLASNNISEKSKADFLSKKYVFGYVENEPYTNVVNNKLIGLDSTYINTFAKVSGASFNYKKYRSVKELTKDLNSGKVDVAPNYYNYSGLKGDFKKTISPYDEEYVILVANDRTDIVVNSSKSLNGLTVMTTNSTLAKYLKNESGVNVKAYDKVSNLISSIDKNSIIALDRNVFEMYKDSNLSNYRVIYSDKENLEYGYLVNNKADNVIFNKLFSNYMEICNVKLLYNIAWKDFTKDSKEISYVYLYIIGVALILFILWLLLNKQIKYKKSIKKEDNMRYIDQLTSLKNRNYLNKNFKSWENNTIYPQSIIIINLNNLRHVNDVYGHEEGDKLIRLAANTLIKNQLDQSDIIRTDGNEYLIYMVGYEKNKVVSYMRKLYKELSDLPYGYGATLGYSMIEDDIKTIDDAINEAVLEIRASKEMNKNKKEK